MTKKTEKADNHSKTKKTKEAEVKAKAKKKVTEEVAEEQEEPFEEKSKEEELEEKLAELQDRYLRLSAEYDNYRKRTLKEKVELLDGAKEDVFLNILPVIDDVDRALEVINDAKDLDAVKEGMNLIYSKFKGFLTQQGVKEIEAMDKDFDTDRHEAITKIKVDSKKKSGKVVDVVEKGYKLKDKVIRFSKVVIGE